ncbi:MAG: AAA family ATPase [Planctomycetota bacterium]
MLHWIRKFVTSSESESTAGFSGIDEDLVLELHRSLKDCEAIYRASAKLCAQVCPEKLPGGPDAFSDLMIDLHRGLLVKILVEIAHCDRRWHRTEKAAAEILLKHVWGQHVTSQNIEQALAKAEDLAGSLQWDGVLKPFVRLRVLHDQFVDVESVVIRIANIIAKADGTISSEEAEALTGISNSIEAVFAQRKTDPAKKSSPRAASAETSSRAQANQWQPSPIEKAVIDLTRSPGDPTDPFESDAAVSVASKPGRPEGKLSPADRIRALRDAMDELDGLIGLDAVKRDMKELISFLKIQEERRRQNLPLTSISLHTVFEGNPGTGKTTVARILGKALGGLGVVQKGHTVETDRSGLVAQFAGQTGPRVNEHVNEALDGVLFIDEAYSLVSDTNEDAYGQEAIQVLLKRMEDDRHRLVVIVAGYPDPMDRMLESNPGLLSRFQRTISFSDYDSQELLQIFERLCDKNHYTLTPAARTRLKSMLETCVQNKDEHFGNARLVRNIFEHAIRRLATRIIYTAPLTKDVLCTIHPDDLAAPNSE